MRVRAVAARSMNGALPLLLLLSSAGLPLAYLCRGRDDGLGRAWFWVGLAGVALLAPVLVMPDGVPSPAGSLAALPPWQGTGDPADGNPELRDVTFQVQPWLLYLRSELREGRWPFWNPHQLAGTPYWSNGSAAPVFPLHLLFALLPVELGLVLLPWLRLLIAGCGAYLLARRLEVSQEGSRVAAVAYPLSGMLVSFSLYPMGNALMLVPFVLWGVEGWAAGRASWKWLAAAGGLQLLSGHPETCLHTCLLSALYLAVRGGGPKLRLWLGWLAGWATAALLAAILILPLAMTLLASSRWGHDAGPPASLSLAGRQLLRLVLPNLYGLPSRHDYWGEVPYVSTAVYVGAAVLVLALGTLVGAWSDRRWRAVLVLLGVALLGAYHVPGVYQLIRSLPLVGQAAPHRLIFGIELALVLLAGRGLDRLLAGRRRGLWIGPALVAALLAAAWAVAGRQLAERGELIGEAAWSAGLLLVAASVLLVARAPEAWRRRFAAGLPALVALDLVLAHHAIHPPLARSRLYPVTDSVRFLDGRPGRVAGLGSTLHANAAMVYGLYDIRGDESVKLERYERYYAALSRAEPIYAAPVRRWGHPRLDELGVRWVVAGPRQRPPVAGWELRYEGEDARVFERPSARSLVRWRSSGAATGVEVSERLPGRWVIACAAPHPDTLVVAETWDRGWRATFEGEPVEVAVVDDLFLGVELPAGAGRVVLRYRPDGFGWGLVLSLLGLGLLGAPGAPARLR